MKRTVTTPPYLSFCLIVRNCEQTLPGVLEKCLQSLRARAPEAEIVVVDTMSSDATPEIARRYADVFEEYRGPRGTWTREMLAFDDAAAARNRSFDLASGTWLAWVDADDTVEGGAEAERLLKLNGRWKPQLAGAEAKDAPGACSLEELLQWAEKDGTKVVWCPYLYQHAGDGLAKAWQDRERFVLRTAGFRWTGAAHETLVPSSGNYPKMLALPHLLFVHWKKWTSDDYAFTVQRHYKIMRAQYDAGDRSPRILRYLCNFAQTMAPPSHEQFLNDFDANAVGLDDLYQARIARGQWEASRGFYLQAQANFGAAATVQPQRPDAFILAGRCAAQVEDWSRAVEMLHRALATTPNWLDCVVGPLEFATTLRLEMVDALGAVAADLVKRGRVSEAEELFARAVRVAEQALAEDIGDGPSRMRRTVALDRARQALETQRAASAIEFLRDFLRRNDETEKATRLLQVIPHTLEDHPTVISLERWSAPLLKHLEDPEAYSAFYAGLTAADGSVATGVLAPDWLTERTPLARVQRLIAELNTLAQELGRTPEKPLKVIEFGSYDGNVAIPVLLSCPSVEYTAVEISPLARARMLEYAAKAGVEKRLEVRAGALEAAGSEQPMYHAAVLFEVIEHVQSPGRAMLQLATWIHARDGRVFVSTPWGAFDNGHPDESVRPRDPRGHVRAMTLRELLELLQVADLAPETICNDFGSVHYGDTMFVKARFTACIERQVIAFCVGSALWDWNGSHVRATGIGASEETIVYLAEALAAEGHQVTVYGPVPEEEVCRGVAYLKQEKMRHIAPGTRVVVSRWPGGAQHLDQCCPHPLPGKILWLQDAWYPDLAKAHEGYEKVVVLTEWHKSAMARLGVPREKMQVINNFLLKEHFAGPAYDAIEKQPHHFIYSSSPDRGLIQLLKLWPGILDMYPDATLSIFYGWEGALKLSAVNSQWAPIYKAARAEYEQLRWQRGVVDYGRVNHAVLAQQMKRASVWAYQTNFSETGCLTVAKVAAAGCVPVCTPLAGLIETATAATNHEVKFVATGANERERFLARIKEAVEASDESRAAMSRHALQVFDLHGGNAMVDWRALLTR